MIATLNGWIATALIGLGLVVFGIGLFFAIFAWMNDGLAVALRMVLTTTSLAIGLGAGGLLFRMAASAHTRMDPRRWWIQGAVLLGAWLAAGLAMYGMSLVDRLIPPR